MITEGWMNHKGGRFTADISEIDMHTKSTGKDVHCPGCKAKLKLTDFTVRKDDEGDVSTWSLKHDCGADLTIFNESSEPSGKAIMAKSDVEVLQKYGVSPAQMSKARKLVAGGMSHEEAAKKVMETQLTFKQFLLSEAKKGGPLKGTDMVEPHDYSVKLLSVGKTGKWPALKGEIYEKDVLIGTFSRGSTRQGYVPPIESKFRTDRAKMRFMDFADSLSVEETIEALLPKSAFR
jgi:hypothetical protein